MNLGGQASERQKLCDLLGDLPDREYPISVKLIEEIPHDGYLLQRLVLNLNGIEPVPAYFVKPMGAREPLPCLLYNHAHGGEYHIGKEELITARSFTYKIPYAKALTSRGYAALCIDTWAFGERRGRKESELFKEMLWNGRVMWGMMVYDSLRAVDYLVSRPDVDQTRIGTIGMSMGSTMAWWTAALDTRLKVCVDICCLTDFQALIKARGLDQHGIYYYVPSLLKYFTTARINALIAPRPHLSLVGNYDTLTPAVGVSEIDRELTGVYGALGCPDAWQLKRYDVAHLETAEMRMEILDFIEKRL